MSSTIIEWRPVHINYIESYISTTGFLLYIGHTPIYSYNYHKETKLTDKDKY